MWHNTRRGFNLIRKRNNERKAKLNIASICVVVLCVFTAMFGGVLVYKSITNGNSNNNNTNNNKADLPAIETNASENLQNTTTENSDKKGPSNSQNSNNSSSSATDNNLDNQTSTSNESKDDKAQEKTFRVSFLGELMMGGEIGETLNYNYMSAFRGIVEYTKEADYTSVNLGTNIIDLDKIENAKSKYIVTKNIENAFSALGIDGINIASDHMLDFGKEIFQDTVDIINSDYDLIGMKDTIVYAEHDGIKIGIIGVCNEVIGTQGKYESAGIMMYNLSKLKAMIKEAKQNVNTVVLLTHLGLENTYNVTNVMTWFYKELINAGADIVLGDHALGLHPIKIYKGKPIIYSMGTLMSDTSYEVGKETGIFSINIDEKGYLKSLEILPLYINEKYQTVLYSLHNKEMSNKLINNLVENLDENVYEIESGKVIINLAPNQ